MKKYVKWTIGLTVGMLVLIMAFMILLDPLSQYHLPLFGWNPAVSDQKQYTVPGLAKNSQYTNAIIGTCMSQNFVASDFDDIFGGKTVKLAIAGSHSVEYHKVLDIVLKNSGLTNIIMNVDCMYLQSDPEVGRWEDLPNYLYDYDYFNDVNYLLNKEIAFKFGNKLIKGNINSQESGELILWDKDLYNKECVRKLIEQEKTKCDETTISRYESWSKRNIETLCSTIEKNSNVHFTVFFAPYSIAWWYDEYRCGKLEYWEKTYNNLIERLINLDNVSIFLLTSEKSKSIITDLDNYSDKEHYSPEVNNYIFEFIKNGENLLSDKNYKKAIDDYFYFIRNYNYEQMFEN